MKQLTMVCDCDTADDAIVTQASSVIILCSNTDQTSLFIQTYGN